MRLTRLHLFTRIWAHPGRCEEATLSKEVERITGNTNDLDPMKREVVVSSLEEWMAEYQNEKKWGERLERMPARMTEEWFDVRAGRTGLKTPDGCVWWVPVSGHPEEPLSDGYTAQQLSYYVTRHMTRVHPESPRAIVLFDRATLDPTYVFCNECATFTNLSKYAAHYDAQPNRGWDD